MTARRRSCPLVAEKVAQCYRRFLTDMQSHSGARMYAALSSAIDDGGTLHVVTRRAGSAGYGTGTLEGFQSGAGWVQGSAKVGCVRLQRGAEGSENSSFSQRTKYPTCTASVTFMSCVSGAIWACRD